MDTSTERVFEDNPGHFTVPVKVRGHVVMLAAGVPPRLLGFASVGSVKQLNLDKTQIQRQPKGAVMRISKVLQRNTIIPD